MKEAGLCVFNNNWYQIYDFNAFEGDDSHWTLLPEIDLSSFLAEASKYMVLTCDPSLSLVPRTFGHREAKDNRCLVVIFPNGTEAERARKLIDRAFQRSVGFIVKLSDTRPFLHPIFSFACLSDMSRHGQQGKCYTQRRTGCNTCSKDRIMRER